MVGAILSLSIRERLLSFPRETTRGPCVSCDATSTTRPRANRLPSRAGLPGARPRPHPGPQAESRPLWRRLLSARPTCPRLKEHLERSSGPKSYFKGARRARRAEHQRHLFAEGFDLRDFQRLAAEPAGPRPTTRSSRRRRPCSAASRMHEGWLRGHRLTARAAIPPRSRRDPFQPMARQLSWAVQRLLWEAQSSDAGPVLRLFDRRSGRDPFTFRDRRI